MTTFKNKLSIAILSTAVIALLCACSKEMAEKTSNSDGPLRVGIAPYQELALLVNAKPLGLEEKYGTKIELLTMPWEDLLPAVASAGRTIDVGFASLPDYLAKTENLNKEGDDPILYLFPAWSFHGGGFVTFNNDMPQLTAEGVKDPELVKKFFHYRIGVQNNSCFHMLLWRLAHKSNLKFSDQHTTDTTLNDGMLAILNGSLDATAAGLTQTNEALKRHGRIVLAMDTLGHTDPGGFICKRVFMKRKKDVESLIRMWFDCTNYVLSDLDHHSAATLAYLKANSSTQYSLAELKRAYSYEYIPRSILEANREIVFGKGKYSIQSLAPLCNQYLLDIGAVKTARPIPKIITIDETKNN